MANTYTTSSYTFPLTTTTTFPAPYIATGIQEPIGDITVSSRPRCLHEMADEIELDNGKVMSRCRFCNDEILGRRLPGGLGLPTLKAALILAMGDRGALAALAGEMQAMERMIEVEEDSLESARRLLGLARRMLTEILDDTSLE